MTFTHETWAAINKQMDTEFADRSIVGWYHTHPDFGIFLSDRDRFIHEHFFSSPGAVAYVVDPIRHEEGFFIWSKGKPTACKHYWVGPNLKLAPPATSEPKESRAGRKRQGEGEAETGERRASGEPLPRDYAWSMRAMVGLCLFLIGYLFAQRASDTDRLRLQQGVVAYYGINKVLKPGLGAALDSVSAGLANVSGATRKLAAEQLKPSTRPALEFRQAWDEILQRTAEYQRRLEVIRDLYALSPQDEALLQQVIIDATATAGGELKASPAGRSPAPTTQARTARQ